MVSPPLHRRISSAVALLRRRVDPSSDRRRRHQSHAFLISLGLHRHPFYAAGLISSYSASGSLAAARSVFDSVPVRTALLYNSLIANYARRRFFLQPMGLFVRMCREGCADGYTFSAVAKVCGEAGDSVVGEMVHCRVLGSGFAADLVVSNSIAAMYCRCRCFVAARKVFDDMPLRNAASWNVVMAACAGVEGLALNEEVLGLLTQMGSEGIRYDDFTVAILLNLCANEGVDGDWYGRQIHCFVIRNRLASDFTSQVHVGSCLIDMYAKCNLLIAARRVFNWMEYKNVVSWTAMIGGYARSGDFEEALGLFRRMQVNYGLMPNRVSLLNALSACRSFAGLLQGRQVHAFSIRSDLNHDVTMKNSLIDMYSKCGCMKSARAVFDADPLLNDQISWSSIISSYGLHGMGKEATVLFNKMCETGIRPDHITSVGVLSACERAGLLTEGLGIYNTLVTKHCIMPTEEVCSCVVGLLGRSGQLDQALNFIKNMLVEPGPSVWGALLDSSVIHGNAKMQELAHKRLLEMEPDNASNYVSLSNILASSGRWNVVGEVRSLIKDKGLKKMPGCSWISVDGKIYSFFASDTSHPCSELIYSTLQNLVLVMRGNNLFGHLLA